MAITFVKQVQQIALTTGTTTDTVTLAQTVAAGNFLVLLWEQENDNTNVLLAPTDTGSNTWTIITPSTSGATDYCSGIAYTVCTGGFTTSSIITLNWTNSNFQYKQGILLEFAGIATSSIVDASSSIGDTFGSAVSIPITTTNANDVIVASVSQLHAQTYTAGSGWTSPGNQSYGNPSRIDALYQIVSATGTYDPAGTLAGADNYRGNIAAFKAASGGGGGGSGPPVNTVPPVVSGIPQVGQTLTTTTGTWT